MRLQFTYLLVLFFAGLLSANGQENRANRLFAQEAYSQAARLYERVLEKDPDSRIAINNLAHCYRFEKRYAEALNYFAKSRAFSLSNSTNHFHFAEMHYLLGDYDQAIEVLEAYVAAAPEDPEGERLLEWCNIVKNFPEAEDFEIKTLMGINSPYADFSPVVHNAGLVFTTERKEDSGKEEFAIEDRPFTNLYYAPYSNAEKTSFWSPDVFSKSLTSRFHDGPVCFNQIGNRVYYTQVNREFVMGGKVNPMKIFTSVLIDGKWTSPEEFPYNSNDYSVGHAALSDNDSLLIFASDMPGGQGGMDLYLCRWENGRWGAPQNLGPRVNTSGDEVFPHLSEGSLYFSSNGWPGYGGLDLFRTHLDSLDRDPQNLYAPINSAWDDLSITWLNPHKAYFSSDRPGGMGRDDIYGVERKSDEMMHRKLSGILEYDDQPAPYASLMLKDESGNVLQKTTTNEAGRFTLNYVESDVNYSLSLDMDHASLVRNFVIYLLNNRDQKVQEIKPNEYGDFTFELLPPDDFDDLELLDVEDVSLLSLDIRGQVFEHELGDYAERIEVQILNADGQIVNRTITRSDGKFLFSHLFPDDQYIFRLLANNPMLQIAILDGEGNVLRILKRKGEEFLYERIAPGDPVLDLLNERNISIRVSPDDQFAIPNIYYDLDSYALKPEAHGSLDRLVEILNKNPDVGVDIMSHTDSRASDQYNLRLSEKRAQGVVQYLNDRGVTKRRMRATGFGETRLVNHCDNDVPCTEEEHAENRRTEFSFFSIDN